MISKAFGLPPDTLTALTMIQNGSMPIVEIDDYPAQASERPREAGHLPPGNALVSLAVESLDACGCDWIGPPAIQEGRSTPAAAVPPRAVWPANSWSW